VATEKGLGDFPGLFCWAMLPLLKQGANNFWNAAEGRMGLGGVANGSLTLPVLRLLAAGGGAFGFVFLMVEG
jgi:hypothetical protein